MAHGYYMTPHPKPQMQGLGFAKSEIQQKLAETEALLKSVSATVGAYPEAAAKTGAGALIEAAQTEFEKLSRKVESSWGWANTYNKEEQQNFDLQKKIKKIQQDIVAAAAPTDGSGPDLPDVPGLNFGGSAIPWVPIAAVLATGALLWWYTSRNR